MLKCKKTTLALLLTLVVTTVVIVLRLTLVPWAQGMDGGFNLGYIVVLLILLTVAVLFVLLRLGREELPQLPTVSGSWMLPLAVTVIAVGGCVLFSTVADMYMWAAHGVAPAPGTQISSGVDRITLFLSLIFGVLSGIYFVRLGTAWLRTGNACKGIFPLWAMAPTFWIWMRLARYEVSYASAVEVHESFYDFAMLIMSMLFLFAFARVMTDVHPKKPYLTVFFALGTALLSISGSVARVFLFLVGEGELSRTGQLAGISDFMVGLLAVAFLLYWLFAEEAPEEQSVEHILEEEVQEQEQLQEPTQADMLVEDILESQKLDFEG